MPSVTGWEKRMLPTRFWADMSWRDFAAADMSAAVAVLPVAATEQHGPHLPVGVDAYHQPGLSEARGRRVTPADWPVLFLPPQAIGKSNEHVEFPGTLTFSQRDADPRADRDRRLVARTGCRKLVFINSHGGNMPAIDIVGATLRVHFACSRCTRPGSGSAYPEGCSPSASARTASTAATSRLR